MRNLLLFLIVFFIVVFKADANADNQQLTSSNINVSENKTDVSENALANMGKINELIELDNLNEYKALVPLKTVGSAKFTVMFWDVYQSTLLSSTGNYPIQNKQQQLLFEITYLKDISKNDLVERTVEQWQHLGLDEEEFIAFIPELERMWPDIVAGDSLALLVNDNSSSFYFNNDKIGDIHDENFGQIFLNIWLAHNTSQPKLRTQLLGEKS